MRGPAPHSPESEPAKGPAAFDTTDWSVVLDAGTDGARKRRALEKLCRIYWQPVYGFIRHLGNDAEHAKDLTQAFFAHLLENDFFATADPERGRFRAYLRQTCRHFLGNQWQKQTAQKRGGSKPPIPLEELDAAANARFSHNADPAAEYDRQWALALLRNAMTRLEEEYRKNGEARLLAVLRPHLTARPAAGDYDRVARELGVSRGAVPVLVHRLGKRYQELIRAEVAATVATRSEVEAELRHCLAALGG
ncbi:MAG: sigma-70 family RNA polymerase sigma factor [Opitutaceae bacterium]|nr:sigma-70 family RNA polymerase sigma factor [Opitutaceae bacterium]